MTNRVTLKQVAELAGVSYQTVSKVINGKASVSKETEERIWAAVRQLGYRPHLIARGLRSQRSQLIGYSWPPSPPSQPNPILDQFLQSMFQAAEQEGYHLLTFPHHEGEDQVNAYRELIDTARVDGFIISAVEMDDPRIAFLIERSFPFVAFGRANPDWDFPYVEVDGAAGMRQAVRYLLSLGHRNIFALAWPEQSRVGKDRLRGYLETMQKAGLQPATDWIARGEGAFEFGYAATDRWLRRAPSERPTAIVALNDVMAIGAMQAVRDHGLRVGMDVSVVGFDDYPLVEYLSPALTTVRQPIEEVGRRIVSMLVRILKGDPLEERHVLLEPELVVRASSGPPAV